jgi:hypothetical protein
MRTPLLIATILGGSLWMVPANAASVAMPGLAATKANVASSIEDVGWRRRYYRRGYRVPYAYYPPAYGYYPPPVYYAPVYPAYPYYAPYRYYRPYYAPY